MRNADSLMLLVIAYVKKVLKALEAKGDAEAVAEFKANAAAAIKKISANYDNYDVMMGQSMDGDAMYVPVLLHDLCTIPKLTVCPRHILIDFRDDGVTPFATLWKHGLKENKV